MIPMRLAAASALVAASVLLGGKEGGNKIISKCIGIADDHISVVAHDDSLDLFLRPLFCCLRHYQYLAKTIPKRPAIRMTISRFDIV